MQLTHYERVLKWRAEHLWMLYQLVKEYYNVLNIQSFPSEYFREPTLDDLQSHWRDYRWAVEDIVVFSTMCLRAEQLILECKEKMGE